MQIPVVSVDVTAENSSDKIYFDIVWKFDKLFSAETVLNYDINSNNNIDEEELKEVNFALENYIKKDSYLTFVNYIENKRDNNVKVNIIKRELDFNNSQLVYKYSFYIEPALVKNKILKLNIKDKGNFFYFKIEKFKLKKYDEYFTKSFLASELEINTFKNDVINSSENVNAAETSKKISILNTNSFVENLKAALFSIMKILKEKMQDIKSGSDYLSYVWLFTFSLLYGMLHAIGPGHGKTLVGAYFMSSDKSYIKAFSISTLIALVHTFSAMILTFVIYYILNSYLSRYFKNIEYATIKISAIVIISIGLYLIYKKVISKKRVIKNFSVSGDISLVLINTNNLAHISSCGCNNCKKSDSTDLAIILSAGIVPCPGTITIFVFTMSLGIYYVGLISAIFMSLGMSIIIFLVAIFSIKVRQKATKNILIIRIIDYFSLLFIIFLGIVLLII